MDIKEFEVLRYIAEHYGVLTQRLIAEETGFSLGTVNSVIAKLTEQGYVSEGNQITSNGYKALDPFQVKNAIILAAGMSTRFIPVSYELPKGLISVKGEVMIERLIRQLQDAGVQEIVVVVGYMMEKFIYLRNKYGVRVVVNNEYATKNTHSSIYVARDYLSNTYICCSDNYYPQNLFHKYEYRAFYCSTYVPGISYVERAFIYDKDGLVVDTAKPSKDQWVMYGHAYFDQIFTDKFRPILESYFGRLGIEYMYWETVYSEHVKELPMWIKKYTSNDILEFDSMEELKVFDPDYIRNNKVKVFENICEILHCDVTDISNIEVIKKGLNNRSFKFDCCGQSYVYRHPGINAMSVIDRKKEAVSLRIAKQLGIDETFIHIDEEEGWKISKYVETTGEFDFANLQHVELLAQKLRILHGSKTVVGFSFSYQDEADKIMNMEKHIDALAYRRMLEESEKMEFIFEYLKANPWQTSLCHNDIYEPNLLLSDRSLQLIDWEFAGDADIGFDICKLFAVCNADYIEMDRYLKKYYGRATTKEEKLHLLACAAVIYYYWYIWGIFAAKNSEGVADYLLTWYDKMVQFRTQVSKIIEDGR